MKLSGLVPALAMFAARRSAAEFTNAFDDITRGSSLTLTWNGGQPQQYPLCITAQVIDKRGDGFSANAYRVNITTGASGTSYVWTGAPYPLRWVAGGLYQLELRPMSWTGEDAPLLARSPFFAISDPETGSGAGPDTSASTQPTTADSQSGDASGISTSVAIGLGVAIGVPSMAALVVVSWCFRKRQHRAFMEKARLKRADFVIT
ncbi:hypothetical protein C8A03DRAFT_16932 [Achaetomium macrosporum]|uniref:Uncharacterized protein n=1 Tax=Achaetomium macrosporum TaxID=79813 RepID=A0AAN7HDJ5_9PEZI|nr:hypothetical protein C8A03DRAFT_16932 [Achaetomium macrosporum]